MIHTTNFVDMLEKYNFRDMLAKYSIYSCLGMVALAGLAFFVVPMIYYSYLTLSGNHESKEIKNDEETKQWTCECGQVNTGNYCQNCGKEKQCK